MAFGKMNKQSTKFVLTKKRIKGCDEFRRTLKIVIRSQNERFVHQMDKLIRAFNAQIDFVSSAKNRRNRNERIPSNRKTKY